MAPKYQFYCGFAVKDALALAGAPRYGSKFQEGEPPVAFFTEPPKNSAAVFSTVHGTRPFRLVENPAPEREGHYWWAAEIQRVCDELRRNLPDACRKIETPQNYWDLYKYFDAYDIYHRGAQNLWNVINTFVFENQCAQKIVDDEKKMQTERYMPLFEYFASELLKRPEIQTKLATWDRERQRDVLKVLTAYELRIFEGYERYPDYFLEAIRAIFVRRYENLRKGPGSLAPCIAPIGERTPDLPISDYLAGLRYYLECIETVDDPFMDKFEIPNRIINGIVIVDGTSKTAAARAKYEAAISSNNLARQKAMQENGAHRPPLTSVPAEDVSSFSKKSGGTMHRVSTTERCVSAPSIGGNPANILSDTVNKEARVYPGDGHEVDKKLMGCREPASPDNNTGHDFPGAAHTLPISMPPLDSYRANHRMNVNQSPPVPSYQMSGTRDRGMSQGPFAHQIPPHPTHQQDTYGPPPMIQQSRNYGKGKWQHIGSDDIHGPKVIFRKGSQTDRDFATMGRNLQTSRASGSWGQFRCVNTRRSVNLYHKFDPCPCDKCRDRDRTIFINRLKEGINQTEGALQRLKQHFSQFGYVDSVTPLPSNLTCVHVMFANIQSAVAAVHAGAEVQIDDLGEKPFRVQFRTGSQFFIPRDPKKFANNPFENRGRPAQNVQGEVSGSFGVQFNTWHHTSLSEQQPVVSLGSIAPEGQPLGADLNAAPKHATDRTDEAAMQSDRGIETTGRLSYSKMTSPIITPHPIHGLVVVDATSRHNIGRDQGKHSVQIGRVLPGRNTQKLVGDITDPTHEITTSLQASHHGTPNNTAQLDHCPPQTGIATSNSQDSSALAPGNADSAKSDEEASIDYGTVRIRPGKARYMAIPPVWRQESTLPQNEHETRSQYLEITSQCGLTPLNKADGQPIPHLTTSRQEMETMERPRGDIKALPQHESGGDKMPVENESLSGHHDSCSHVKRKASETDRSEKAPDRPSPKKKFSKLIQPPDSLPGAQTSEPGYQQHKQQGGGTSKTKSGKKKKNKNRQNPATQPGSSSDTSTATPFEAKTFKPAIATSHLPPYPPQNVQRETQQKSEPVYVRIPPTPPRFGNRLDESEPFPPYRDLMSGPQMSPSGHGSHASVLGPNRSMSSNASSIINMHDFGPQNYRFNPGAQNFIPGPANTGYRGPNWTFDSQVSAMPNPQDGSYGFRSPGRLVWGPQDIGMQEALPPRMQKRIERTDSSMSAAGQPPIQKSTQTQSLNSEKVEDGKADTENSKSVDTKDEAVPKPTGKGNNGNKASTGAKQQGGGKGKGKSKNAKAGRNDQKSAIQGPVDGKGESAKPIGLKDATNKKAEAAIDQSPEVLKKDVPAEEAPIKKHAAVVESKASESSKHDDGVKDAKTAGQPDKGKSKEVAVPEKKAVAKEVEGTTTTTTTEAKPKKAPNDDKEAAAATHPEPPQAACTTSETKTAPTACTPAPSAAASASASASASSAKVAKQGKAKNRAPKKGVGAQQQQQQQQQQAPIARPSTSSSTSASTRRPATATAETKTQDTKQTGLIIEGQQAKTIPALKPLPALAPIPLYAPGMAWRTAVAAKKKKETGDVKDVKEGKDVKEAGKGPPLDGERKGG
ncbi:hypothetical protein F4803DRAFT_222512 [Xylaria telfairii]|nr:hypothetical protein F4803DRAFT_222512 [Xylaria telfairii]